MYSYGVLVKISTHWLFSNWSSKSLPWSPVFYYLLPNFATRTAFHIFFSRHEALRVANFQMKKDNIKRKPLGTRYKIFGIFNIAVSTNLYVFISIELTPDSVHTYVPVESKLQYPPSGNPPGNWILRKFLFKLPNHRSISGDQMPHPRENYQITVLTFQ